MGGVEGAVKTVTGVPPPCGFRSMLWTLTPMVAQSSVGSSLNITLTVPVCDCGAAPVSEETRLPAQPVIQRKVAAAAATTKTRVFPIILVLLAPVIFVFPGRVPRCAKGNGLHRHNLRRFPCT